MKGIEIIDVSLRDGGYRTNFHFSDEALETIISSLDEARINYIEIGYRNGSIKPIQSIGPSGLCDKKYLKKCRALAKRSKLSVMLHPKNVKDDDLNELVDCGVELCRICVVKNGYDRASYFIEKAINIGLQVSANITRVSQYSENDLDFLVSKLQSHKLNMLYFADSNGSLTPQKVEYIYKKYSRNSSFSLGFHAHDNLGLAQTNAITALSSGARYIDVSLSGIGKGVGNLKTEFFLSYLSAIGVKKYNVGNVLNGSNLVSFLQRNHIVTVNDFLMGIKDLSIDDLEEINLEENEYI